jgi:hypothetical protein
MAICMSIALEKHFRVAELADLWGFCQNTVIKMFTDEDGVIRWERQLGKRKYTTLSIPESVAVRVHERLSQKAFQSQLATGNPLRVIRFRDLDGAVPQKPRHVLKLKAA